MRDREDLLTSAVFGHLRYVPPGPLWSSLFRAALSLPIHGRAHTLEEYARAIGLDLSAASSVAVHFWPSHPEYGEPDLLLRFSFETGTTLALLIEAKLWSQKGAPGQPDDQLVRYIHALDDLAPLLGEGVHVKESVLVYLTPRESAPEIEQSLSKLQNRDALSHRVYRLQWQDILEWATSHASGATGVSQQVLENIGEFLRRRNLSYFRGFSRDVRMPAQFVPRSFYQRGAFDGFRRISNLEKVHPLRAQWVSTARRPGTLI